jgi:fructose-bisphosphate aldolase class I
MSLLHETVQKMMTPGKGILASDESNSTAGKRLSPLGLENTEENRRTYRELFIDTENIEKYLSGIILYDETIRQSNREGKPLADILKEKDIVIGIKVDEGARDLPGFPQEKITYGLDQLEKRLEEYFRMGARFAKWRAVITIGEDIPTDTCIKANAHALARYANLCQNANIVPMVEPEVLLNGNHTIDRAQEVTEKTLIALFDHLKLFNVDLKGTILKTSMVLSGSEQSKDTPAIVAERTVETLLKCVPEELGGVVFLSGGQSPDESAENLNAIAQKEPLPWEVTFSYARAIQGPALEVWGGKEENLESAREAYLHQLEIMTQADHGKLK